MIKFYENLRPHVGTSRGLGIPDDETHQDRLMMAASFLNRHKIRHLLDVGCGYGDLRMHVLQADYMGIDIHDWMIDEARRRLPATPFKTVALKDFPPDPARFDVVAALGVLATVPPEELATTLALMARNAGHLLIVSFVRNDIGYKGSVHSHALADVVGDYPVLETGEKHGETTVLLDVSR